VKVAIASSSLLAIPTLQSIQTTHEIVTAISMPDAPQGRGRQVAPNPFAQRMTEIGFETAKPNNQQELEEVLASSAAELVVTVAYGRLIKLKALQIPRHGWLNLHFSLLPKYRGAAPVQHAILHGETETGVTVFSLDEGMDTGPIYESASISLRGDETAGNVLTHLSHKGADLVMRAIEKIERGIQPIPQIDSEASLAPKITKENAKINWGSGVDHIDRLVRAMNPEPGAWTTFRGERFHISQARKSGTKVGGIGEISISHEIAVSTIDGSLILEEVKPAGKKTMSAKDWVRGARFQPGESFL